MGRQSLQPPPRAGGTKRVGGAGFCDGSGQTQQAASHGPETARSQLATWRCICWCYKCPQLLRLAVSPVDYNIIAEHCFDPWFCSMLSITWWSETWWTMWLQNLVAKHMNRFLKLACVWSKEPICHRHKVCTTPAIKCRRLLQSSAVQSLSGNHLFLVLPSAAISERSSNTGSQLLSAGFKVTPLTHISHHQ